MAEVLDFMVNLSLMTSGNFDSSITPAVRKLQELQTQTQELQKVSGQTEKFARLQSSITQNQSTMLSMSQAARNLTADIAANQARTAQLQGQYSTLKSQQEKLIATGKKNTDTYRNVTERMKTLQVQIRGNEAEGRKLEAQQKKLSAGADKLQSGLDRDRESLARMRTALNDAGIDTGKLAAEQDRLQRELSESTQAQQRLSQAQAKYEGYKKSLSWGNIKGDIITSTAAVQTFRKPVQVMMDFEQAMANVRAVNNASDEDFAMLRTQALQLGSSTQFSASQAAATQESLARGGFSPQQIIDAMPAVLSMAAAEGMDLAQAGDIVVKTLGGMGYKDAQGNIDASQSARVADVLANMSASSATNIAELGEGMKIAAPVFSQLGTSIEQVAAYLGGMAGKGYTGSEAGNALASSAMRLSKLPKETYNALAELGVATQTREGKMREFPDIMKAINDAFKRRGFGEAKQLEYMTNIFGQNQGKAMLGLMDAAVSGAIDKLEISNRTEATGKSQAMAGIRNNTLAGDITSLSSAWEGFMISVGKPLEDWSRGIIQALTKGISLVTDFMKRHEDLADIVVKVAAGFAALKVGFTVYNIAKNISGLIGSFFQLRSAMSAANAAMQGASSAGGIFSSLGVMVKGVWGIIAAHPFVAIGAAVSALAVAVWQNWDTIKETAQNCWNAVKEYAGIAGKYIRDLWQGVSDWFASWKLPDMFAPLSEFARNTIDSVKTMFAGLGQWIMDTIGKLNPFNWDMPEWLGGSKEQRTAKRVESAKKISSWDPLSGNLPGFATGGFINSHSIIQVAENGPEAIIPLKDKSRGRELLMQAAGILGIAPEIQTVAPAQSMSRISDKLTNNSVTHEISNGVNNSSISESINNSMVQGISSARQTAMNLYQSARSVYDNVVAGNAFGYDSTSNSDRRNYTQQPTVNITVNSSGNNSPNDLASMIAQKVREALEEFQERSLRLAYD